MLGLFRLEMFRDAIEDHVFGDVVDQDPRGPGIETIGISFRSE